MTIKSEMFAICREVAEEFQGWNFNSRGEFINKTLKHTDLIVDPGFRFAGAFGCATRPLAAVNNKKATRLYKNIVGIDCVQTFAIYYQLELHDFYSPSRVTDIYRDGEPFVGGSSGDPYPVGWIPVSESKAHMRKIVREGISILDKYFDTTSEESFLTNLPVAYKFRDDEFNRGTRIGSFYEGRDGAMHCICALLRGGFDFVENFCSDSFQTAIPKSDFELDKIREMLPDLKRKFQETGSVLQT